MSGYPTYYPDDAYPIGGFWKKVKKAFTPPKKVQQAIKRAVTPGKAVKKLWNKAVAAPIKRLSKANLSDFITKGPAGIVDPKIGKVMQDYINPVLIQAVGLLPGIGPIVSGVLGSVYEKAMAAQAAQYGGEIPEEYYEEAQAYALEEANAAAMREAASMGAPLFGDDVVTRQTANQSGLPSWVVPVGILGVAWYFTRSKR